MRVRLHAVLLSCACLAAGSGCSAPPPGHIAGRVTAPAPSAPNPGIRMASDPVCASLHGDAPATQDLVVRAGDGGLANVFVYLDGAFASSPVPAEPVAIDQRGCLYHPRVQGARAGQALRVRSSDATLHSIRGRSATGNDFALSQPSAGMVSTAILKKAEVMLRVRCDVHAWMRAYIGVVDHPHFAVSDAQGRFTMPGVPPGRYRVVAWHETLGTRDAEVEVMPGVGATLDLTFAAAASGAREMPVVDVVLASGAVADGAPARGGS